MDGEGVILILLVAALFFIFPVYVLIRLSDLTRELKELRRIVAAPDRRVQPAPGPAAVPPAAPLPAFDIDLPPAMPLAPPVAAPAPAPFRMPPAETPPSFDDDLVSTLQSRLAAVKEKPDIESLLGADWPAKLGIVAIVLAVSFFLQYAFKSGWIGPAARVFGGLAVSAVLLGAAQFLLRKPRYRTYAQVVASGGIAVFFVCIYTAYSLYHLIGFGTAFAALALGALAASALAIANGTEAVAVLCILGAFAAPVLIRAPAGGSGTENYTGLYSYLVLLNVWVMSLVRLRPWHSLIIVAFAATWVVFFRAGNLADSGWMTEGFATLFLLASCAMAMQALYAPEDPGAPAGRPRGSDIGQAILLAACGAYAVASGLILDIDGVLGLPAFLIAGTLVVLLLSGMGTIVSSITGDETQAGRFRYLPAFALIAVLMVTQSLERPGPFPGGQAPAAFAFTVFHYLLFLGAALILHRREGGDETAAALTAASALVHVLLVLRVLANVDLWQIPAASLWLPLAGALTLIAIRATNWRNPSATALPVALAIVAQALPFTSLFGFSETLSPAPVLRASVFFAEFLAVSLIWIAMRPVFPLLLIRADRAALFVNAAVFFALMGAVAGLDTVHGFVVLAGFALAMALFHAVIGAWALPRTEESLLDRLLCFSLAATFLAIAAALQLRTGYITVAWAVEAAALIWTGAARRERRVLWYGVCLLAVAAFRSIFYDITMDPVPDLFLLNTRMLSGGAVIAAAYLSVWFLERYRQAVPPEEGYLRGSLAGAANVLTLVFVSVDLCELVRRTWPAAERGSAEQLTLSLFWTVYALALASIGIWKRSRPIRLFGMVLLYLSIAKVFLLDLAGLEQPYRIVSFLVLGIILLLVSLLYTSFEERMRAVAPPENAMPPDQISLPAEGKP